MLKYNSLEINRKFNESKMDKPGVCQKQIKKDGCCKQLKYVILQQVNVYQYYYYFKSLPLININIQEWEFYL